MKRRSFHWVMALSSILLLFVSCAEERVKSVAPDFVFKHYINGYEFQKGAMNYTNQAGNLYQVDELQYFISEVSIKLADGQVMPITSDNAIHYVDMDIPSTLAWSPKDRLPVTGYESITFVFGIIESKNTTGLFVNPPERDMFWPEMMGGGYHYMKMNGKWLAEADTIKPFNMHLGTSMPDAPSVSNRNTFSVTLPLNVQGGTLSNTFTITMNIEKWFEAPNVWNWNVIGGQIMQNQDAMQKAGENGANTFQVSHKGEDIVYHD